MITKNHKNYCFFYEFTYIHILNITELPEVFFLIGDQAESCARIFTLIRNLFIKNIDY